MEIATAFVSIRPQTDTFAAEAVAAAQAAGEAAAQSFSDSFNAGLAGASGDSVDVPVEADTAPAEEEIASLDGGTTTTDLEADTSEAEGEITALDGESVTVAVEADTEQAQSDVQSLTSDTSQLGDAAQGAIGGMAGLGGAAGGALSKLGPEGAATAALGAGLFTVASAGLDAASAQQRFASVTGDLGASLRSINVGGLSGDIGQLALKIGSSDESIINATSSFVTFAQASGATSRQIVQTSNNINALALRAAALNPQLGDAGEVAGRLTSALARGGRATTQFGIGLTSAEINAQALADTGKASAKDLTQFEKAAAGAEIAVQRLGGSMGTDFANGAKNSALSVRAFKEQIGEMEEQLGSAAVPSITALTSSLGPTIAALDQAAQATGNFGSALGLVSADSSHWAEALIGNGALTSFVGIVDKATGHMSGQGTVVGQLASSLGGLGSATDAAAAAQGQLAASVDQNAPKLGDIVTQVDAAGAAFGQLNLSSDPSRILTNLQTAAAAFSIFNQQIQTLSQVAPNLAASIQAAGPAAGSLLTSLVQQLQQGRLGVIGQLEGLVTDIQAHGGDVTAALTNPAAQGAQGAVAAVAAQGVPMGAAGQQTGAQGAAGLTVGLQTNRAAAVGQAAGVTFTANVASAIAGTAGAVSAAASIVFSGAGANAYSRGYATGANYAAGVIAGLSAQIGTAVSARSALDQAATNAFRVGQSSPSTVHTHITVTPVLDGRRIAETTMEHVRVLAVGDGYEQP